MQSNLTEFVIKGAADMAASHFATAKRSIIWDAFSVVLISLAVIFMSLALFFYFALNTQLAYAGLFTAIIIFVLAAACYAFSLMRKRQLAREAAQQREVFANLALVALDKYEDEIEQPIKEHPFLSLIISGVTGYAVAKKYF
ncbi:MAG: hypothetical protein CMH25_05800 [Micavibrio sp.]|nr:hypothetical protein [Micavibrio sp.]|tara:strand:- start:1014 stop:1439 length:426 start_codon:yes stop_codon:yes gene_type:complete